MKHAHHCPTCYEHWNCELACTICPDLGTTSDSLPFGSHCKCPQCDGGVLNRAVYDGFLRTDKYHAHVVMAYQELCRGRTR